LSKNQCQENIDVAIQERPKTEKIRKLVFSAFAASEKWDENVKVSCIWEGVKDNIN
jgi:hypothetical protein